jgi:hypothetical protein
MSGSRLKLLPGCTAAAVLVEAPAAMSESDVLLYLWGRVRTCGVMRRLTGVADPLALGCFGCVTDETSSSAWQHGVGAQAGGACASQQPCAEDASPLQAMSMGPRLVCMEFLC